MYRRRRSRRRHRLSCRGLREIEHGLSRLIRRVVWRRKIEDRILRTRRVREIEDRIRRVSIRVVGCLSLIVRLCSLCRLLRSWSASSCNSIRLRRCCRHVLLCAVAFHLHSFSFGPVSPFNATVIRRRSLCPGRSSIGRGCRCRPISTSCRRCLSSSCARRLRRRWYIRSSGTWLLRARRRSRCRSGSRILVLPHDLLQVRKYPALLVVGKIELRCAIALQLRDPFDTLLENVLLLLVERSVLQVRVRAEVVTAIRHDLVDKITEAGLRMRCTRSLARSGRGCSSWRWRMSCAVWLIVRRLCLLLLWLIGILGVSRRL